MTPQDRELWGYFATLYKNSNKGIKGRGKDRKISPSSKSSSSSSSTSSSSSVASPDSGMAVDSRKRMQDHHNLHHHHHQMRRSSYEDYTGASSSEEDEMAYYLTRRVHWFWILDFFCFFFSFGNYWLTGFIGLAFAGFGFLWAIVFIHHLMFRMFYDTKSVCCLSMELIVWLGSDISFSFLDRFSYLLITIHTSILAFLGTWYTAFTKCIRQDPGSMDSKDAFRSMDGWMQTSPSHPIRRWAQTHHQLFADHSTSASKSSKIHTPLWA